MSDILIRLDGEPRGKGRPRFGRGRTYTDATTRRYEEHLGNQATIAMIGRELLTGPLRVKVYAEFPIPASWPKWKRTAATARAVYHTGRPDTDNLVKVIDALNGIVWRDDSQVAHVTAWKRYGPEPHLSIIVSELPDASVKEAA